MANLIREIWESEKYFKNEITLPKRREENNKFFSPLPQAMNGRSEARDTQLQLIKYDN